MDCRQHEERHTLQGYIVNIKMQRPIQRRLILNLMYYILYGWPKYSTLNLKSYYVESVSAFLYSSFYVLNRLYHY